MAALRTKKQKCWNGVLGVGFRVTASGFFVGGAGRAAMAAQVFEGADILLGLGRLGRMLGGDFSGDAGVLGSVDRVSRLLLLGITLILTLGIGVIHLARCQLLRGPPISIFLFWASPNKIKNQKLQ